MKGVDIYNTRYYSRDVNVPAAAINQYDWILRFIPYNGDCFNDTQQMSSSHFYIKADTSSSPASISSSSVSSSSTSSTSSSSTSSSSASTTSSIQPSTATPTTPTAPVLETAPSTSTGLSTGAKAGIGAGIGLAGLLCVAAIVSFLKAKKSREHAQSWFSQRLSPDKEMPMRLA